MRCYPGCSTKEAAGGEAWPRHVPEPNIWASWALGQLCGVCPQAQDTIPGRGTEGRLGTQVLIGGAFGLARVRVGGQEVLSGFGLKGLWELGERNPLPQSHYHHPIPHNGMAIPWGRAATLRLGGPL